MENNDFDFESVLSSKKKVSNELKNETQKFDDLQSLLSKERKISLELKKQVIGFEANSLINCDPINNHDVLVALIKETIALGKKPVVILTSINYKTALDLLEEAKINPSSVLLIDTVSKNIKNVKDQDNLKFIDSLRNLTQIQISLVDYIEANKNLSIIFDSINVLRLYHDEKILLKFIYSISKLLHKYKISGNFIICDDELFLKLGQFFDNLVEIEKVE